MASAADKQASFHDDVRLRAGKRVPVGAPDPIALPFERPGFVERCERSDPSLRIAQTNLWKFFDESVVDRAYSVDRVMGAILRDSGVPPDDVWAPAAIDAHAAAGTHLPRTGFLAQEVLQSGAPAAEAVGVEADEDNRAWEALIESERDRHEYLERAVPEIADLERERARILDDLAKRPSVLEAARERAARRRHSA